MPALPRGLRILAHRLRVELARRIGAQHLCPYCFKWIGPDDRAWRCRRIIPKQPQSQSPDGSPRAPGPDDHYCHYHHSFVEPVCPKCDEAGPRNPTCGHCKANLPPAWFGRKPVLVGVIGESLAGKTHYIVGLHDWWEKHLHGLELSFLPSYGRDIDRERFTTISNEVKGGKSVKPNIPSEETSAFIWEIRSSERLLRKRPFYFFYHDTAGEHLRKIDATLDRSGYILSATTLLFLIDGERLPEIEASLNPKPKPKPKPEPEPGLHAVEPTPVREIQATSTADPLADWKPSSQEPALVPATSPVVDAVSDAVSDDPATGLQNVIRLLREQTNNPNKPLSVPIGICLNKSDRVFKVLPNFRSAIEGTRPRHNGGFDRRSCERSSEVVQRALCEDLKQGNLVELIRANFSQAMFFATSTIGSGEDTRPGAPKSSYRTFAPLGVEDPFLWILWQNGRLRGFE